MIAVQLTNPELSRRPAPRRSSPAHERSSGYAAVLRTDDLPTSAAHFPPLDPEIISKAIPAFFIGRNKDGLWVARDADGKLGGIFLLEDSALMFARKNSKPAGCATIFPSEGFELDLENSGNPLAACLGMVMRLAMRVQQRLTGLIGG